MKYVRWLISVEEPLAQQVDLILLDPTKARVRYGARVDLINQLLKQWVTDIQSGRAQVPSAIQDAVQEEKDELDNLRS